MGIDAVCETNDCAAKGQRVIANLGFKTFDVGMDWEDEVKCPMCKEVLQKKGAATKG